MTQEKEAKYHFRKINNVWEIFHMENETITSIAFTDEPEKAHFLCAAANQFKHKDDDLQRGISPEDWKLRLPALPIFKGENIPIWSEQECQWFMDESFKAGWQSALSSLPPSDIKGKQEDLVTGDNEGGGYYYDLFKFFSDEHSLTLVDTEIQDIIHAVEKFNNHPIRKIIQNSPANKLSHQGKEQEK